MQRTRHRDDTQWFIGRVQNKHSADGRRVALISYGVWFLFPLFALLSLHVTTQPTCPAIGNRGQPNQSRPTSARTQSA